MDADLPPDTVPARLRLPPFSVRVYDHAGLMAAADVVEGSDLEAGMVRLLADRHVNHLHVHVAKPGGFACRADRA